MLAALQAHPGLYLSLALVLGLVVGSFLNVVIHRLPIIMERRWKRDCAQLTESAPAPADETPYSLWQPRSACPQCGHRITALENIPVLSYAMLRGRCSRCRARISARYPAVELLTGVLSLAVAWRFGVTLEGAAALGLTWALIALGGIDLETQYLPDAITLPLLWAGLLLSLASGQVAAQVLFPAPAVAIIGGAAGYLALWSVYQLFKLTTGKEGMGYGDFKLLAALGAWLGWQKLPLIVLLSALVGAAVGIGLIVLRQHRREVPIPYGPYLAAAGWVALVWGDGIIEAYWGAAGL